MKLPKQLEYKHVAIVFVPLILYVCKIVMGGQAAATIAPIQLLTIAAAALAGFVLGWFLSPHAKKFRQIIMIVALVLFFIAGAGDAGVLGISSTGSIALICFILAFAYWIGSELRAFAEPPTTFGSAKWADESYLHEHKIIGKRGIRLGFYNNGSTMLPLHYDSDRHLLTIAPTRSGKGTTAIIPNLLSYKGSALVIDPKGENAMITAAQRQKMGQDVYIVDPWNITGAETTARFNPLDWLVKGDVDISENAMLLADALCVSDPNSDAFWFEEAKALIQGVILYVATDEDEAGHRHLGRVRDLLLLDGEDLIKLYDRMIDSTHHIVISTGARCKQKDPKLMSNVLASAQAQTHIFDSARIRENVSASDFKFEDLKTKPMTIYLVLPSDRLKTFSRWLRLLIQQAITVNARNIEIKPKKPVLFLLDEMTSLGRLTMIEQAYSLMAGFGLQLWGIIQDASRLKEIYGEGWETFIGNSGMIQYFGSRDRMTADYFSALCGVTTVWNFSSAIARAFGSSSGKGGLSTNSSTTYTETTAASQRQLAYPDELMRLHEGKELIFIENLNPIIGAKVRWYEDETLKTLGRNLHQK